MINQERFEIAISSEGYPKRDRIDAKEAGKKCFELAKQMRDDTSKDFADFIGDKGHTYSWVLKKWLSKEGQKTTEELFAEYSGTPASSLAQEAEGKWISIHDRTPDEDTMVLVLTENEPIVIYVVASWSEQHGCFVDYDDCSYAGIHWQPLPSPPSSNKIN